MKHFLDQAAKGRGLWPQFFLMLVFVPLYLSTMLPGLGYTGDTAKFQFIGQVMGVPHATGYPLYIILNKLFIQLPLGSIAFRANLMSVFFALATLLMLYATARRTSGSIPAAFLSSLFLGLGFTFWEQALVAEVYSLNAFLLITSIYLLVRWQESGRSKWLYSFFLVYALSFGNHLTMITVFPAFLAFILLIDKKIIFRGKTLLAASAAVLLGAGQYLLLILRSIQEAPYLEHRVFNLQDLFTLVSGRQFQSSMFVFSPGELLSERLPLIGKTLVNELTWPVLLLSLFGFALIYKKNRSFLLLLFLAIGGQLFYAANYDIPDIYVYFIPALMLFSLAAAAGLARLDKKTAGRRPARALLLAVLVLLGLAVAVTNYPLVDLSGEVMEEKQLNAVFAALPDGALLATDNYLEAMFVKYMQFVSFPEKKIRQLRIDVDSDILMSMLDEMILVLKQNADLRDRFLAPLDLQNNPLVDFEIVHLLQTEPALRDEFWNRIYIFSPDTRQACNDQGIKTELLAGIHDVDGQAVPLWRVAWD